MMMMRRVSDEASRAVIMRRICRMRTSRRRMRRGRCVETSMGKSTLMSGEAKSQACGYPDAVAYTSLKR